MKHVTIAVLATVLLSGCGTGAQTQVAEAEGALAVAAALETAYAAQPKADPKVVAQLKGLLSAGQAALATWQASANPGGAQAVNAAIAALVAYEASAGLTH